MAYKKYARECDECGKGFNEGYCVDGGSFYYCSDECLHKHFTPEEWEEMSDDDGDSYWTTWDEDPDEYLVDDDDPAPNNLSVDYVDAHNLKGAFDENKVVELFKKQLRDRGLDPDKYHLESWTINTQVQIKENTK